MLERDDFDQRSEVTDEEVLVQKVPLPKIAREIAMPKIEDFVEGDPVVEDVEDDSDEDSDDDGPPERERPACEPHPFWC